MPYLPEMRKRTLNDITRNGKVERSISTSCWVQNLVGDGAAGKKREAHVSFFPLQSTVTYDTENITPDEAVVFLKQRSTAEENDAADSTAHRTCINSDTSAVTSIRAAAEIVNSLATSSFLQYSMYSSRNLVPLFMANSRQGEFGGKYMRYSSIRDCFSRGNVVDGLLKDLRKRKVNAAKAFIKAVREKSVVNTALAAWNAGNAANLEKLVDFCRNKYGPDRRYNAAGIHRTAAPASGKAGGVPKTFTSEEFLDEIVRRHKSSLTFDSAPAVFNDALSRVFREFKAAVDSRDTSSPLFAAARQNYRCAKDEYMPNLGMLAPREKHSVAEYMLADKNSSKLVEEISKISTDIENIRGGRKRKTGTSAEDLKDTLAASVSKSAVDASAIGTAADIDSAVTSGENYEWSLHITQLFAQAFLESMASLLSCVFGAFRPFSVDGFEKIEAVISKRTIERVVDMDPTVLADQYLLLTGNFQIPFHVSEHDDVLCGRQVVPNTPLLTLVTRFMTSDNRVVTEIVSRDRLLVGDVELNKSADNVSATDAAQRNIPSAYGEDKKPMMQGCLPVIRGPIAFKRNEANNGADDTINGLANDWYVSVGVYYAMGKSTAAIAAGQQRALASAKSLLTSSKSSKGSLRGVSDEKRLKRSMRENADRAMRTLELLGQGISEWGHSEHNSTLDTFWSSSAAVRSKATQDALNRAELLSMRRQMDGKCTPGTVDEFLVAEQHLRDSFFRAVSRTTSTNVDETILLPNSMSRYKDVFADESSSGLVQQTWRQYVTAMSHLTDYERSAFNVKGLFSAINRFRLPLVPEGKHSSNHRRHNLKAANAIINGLTEMTLQTAVNGTSIGELGFGLGSAQDGWGGYTNCIQPSRMHALKAMSKIGTDPSVISIPVSRSLSGRGDVTSIDIPAVIVSYLISDKRTLDDLCGANNTDLCTEITKFVNNLTGENSQDKSSIFTVGKYSIILLRYIWFNTAVISLTDVNIKTALDFLGRDLGSLLYRDFLAIRRLVNTYNAGLSDISVQAVADHYNCESKGTAKGSGNVTIKTETELLNVLRQTSNALSAFTDKKDGTPASASNMTNSITSVNDTDAVKNTEVVVDITAKQIEQFREMAEFIYDIYVFNMNTEELLRRYALGKGLSKSEIDNMSHPNITAIFKRELGIHGTALNSPMADMRTVVIDLNDEFPLIIKANVGFVTERIAELSKREKNITPEITAELAALAEEAANTDRLAKLAGTIKTPKGITADTAINIVNAFTRDGRFSNKNTHLNILAGALVRMNSKMPEKPVERFTMRVDDVSTFVRDGLLSCLIAAHSTAGRCLLNPVIRDTAKLLRDLVAETSLVVSRLQNSFFPIPPAALSLGDLFKPDRKAFDDMTREYVSEIVKQMTDATTRDMSELCNDGPATSNKMFKAGEIYSKGVLNSATQAITSASSSTAAANFQNPAKVWSVSALPHFDVAVVPKLHPDVSSDQLFRLSTYYQGMHKLSLNPNCAPDSWDSTLAGNRAWDFFGLRSVSDNNRSFNLALDTVLASPAELCDLVSREMVRASNDVVHNIGSMSNVGRVNKLLDQGASAVEKFSASAPSTEESRIRDTVLSLTKSGSSTNESLLAAKEIVKTWNISSLLNINRSTKSLSSGRDVVKAPLEAVPSFRQNVVEATRSLYELAAVCSVMSKDETARTSSLKIMGTFEETSPVMFDIGVSRIAGLVSTVTSNKQQKRLLQTVSDYRNSLVRLVNVNPLSAASSAGPSSGSGSAASSALSSGLKAVYDGMLSSSVVHGSNPASSQTVSLPDRFWMGVFSECLENGGTSFAEQRRSSPFAKLYGSRVNTYAALSTNIDRLKTSMASMDKERRRKIEQSVANIEDYVSRVLTDDTMTKMVDAQKTYNKLADITANSVYADFRNANCHGILKTAASRTKTARQQSDTILAAMLHELASMVYDAQPDLGTQFSLAGHILTAKGVCRELTNKQTQDIFDNLLSVAGVSDFCHVSANTLCSRLKASDIKLFLGGTLLQQGLFLSFLLNNVLFYQISKDLKMAELSPETKSLLVKLVGFCGTVNDALSTRYVSASRILRQRRVAADAEETKLDVSFITSLFSAYRDLRRKTELYRESETVAQIFGRMSAGDYSSASASKAVMVSESARGPRPKRNSTLEDVLQAPSTVHKTFLVSYPEKAAATRQVKRAGGAVLFNNRMEVVYGSDVLNDMRNSSSDYLMQDFCDEDIDMLDEDYEDEFGESYLSSSSDVSDYSNQGDEDDDDYHYSSQLGAFAPKNNKGGGTYSYDALDRLNAAARPLTHIYGCGDDDEDDYEDERSRRGNTQLDSILRAIGESDDDFDEYDENYATENIARRRSERLQYGVGFLSHSFIMDHPAKARAFLSRGKRFKRNPGTDLQYLTDDDAAIFSDESTSSSSSSDDEFGSGSSLLRRSRRAKIYKRRSNEEQFSFISRVMRSFVPTRTTLVDGRVSMVTPVSSDTASGFFENYQKANKKERENLRKQYNIDATQKTSLLQGSDSANPRQLRRSLIKAAAYVYKTQDNNAETFFQAIIKPGVQTVPDPAATLSETVLFSKDLRAVIDKRNELLKSLSEVSSSLFTSSATSVGRDEEILREALDSVSDGDENRSGYLGVPLRNLSRCIKANKGADDTSTDTLTVDQLLAVTDKNHLDWMTVAAISFARSFNVTTFYALDSTLKTTASLKDMYEAFTSLLSTLQEERLKVNSTLLDSIFNTRMAHLEAVMGLVYPTAFFNHEMPHDPVQRRNLQALSLNILRGVNSNQLPRSDIGDTSGLLAFITSSKFAGRGGERGGLSLYRMSITDALTCEPVDSRLKGAVSLEVGKWSMMENSVFSKRSADLIDFCSKNNLTLENAVGPIARFVPDGTNPADIGMNSQLSLYVSDDDAALRLQSAEEGCGAAGRFITASAAGNLFGKIEEITTLANKFAGVYAMIDYSRAGFSATDMAKEIIAKMKAKRNKALKTPFGDTVITQAANLPSLSDSIVMRAREMRHSIATIVTDLSKRYGIFGGPSRTTNSVIPTRVSVSAFKRILETSAVLAKTKMSLRGIENRLAAAYTNLKQFKHIVNDGLSGSKAVFLAIAKSLNTLNFKNDGTEISADELLKQDGILRFVVDIELKNIEDAKNQVTAAIEGTCSLHAKMLSVLTASADFNSSLDRNSVECQHLSDKVSGGNFEPMTNAQCGTIIKHKGTGVWLKTDEECNTKNIGAGGAGGAMNDHRRVAQTIMNIVESNRNRAIRSTLHSMCLGKYAVNDIFVLDDSDAKSVDRLIERLGEALAEKASSPSSSSAASSPSSSSLVGVSTAAAVSEGSDSSSAPKTECLGKTIPYIPIIFENKQKDIKSAGERSTTADASASTSAAEQKAAAMRQLEIQESNDLSNILAVASKHKFATHNQAATVDIFNGRQNAELVIPEKMFDSEYKKTYKGILSRLPTSVSAAIQADISSGSSVQLPPDAMEYSSSSSSSSSVSERLREYATKLASTLNNAPEYKNLKEAQRKISAAIEHAMTVENTSFFTGGARPEIKQTVMSTLSQSQSAKEGALELLEKVLTSLETYTPDPSLASMSVPVNSSSLSCFSSRGGSSPSSDNTDYFHATFEKLNSASLSEDGTDVIVNNTVEQDVAIRVPLLLSSPGFASDLRALVEDMDEYYKRMDKIRVQITSDAKHAVANAVHATDLEISADKKSMIPTIDNLRDMYSNEADDIKTAIKVLENKNSELELQNNRTASIIDNITGRIEAGDNTANANDMLDYGNKADNDQQFLQNLKKFAKDNSGPVYTPPASRDTADASTNNGNTSLTVRDSYRNLMRDAITSIKQGQEGIIVSFDSAIDAFPTPSTEYGKLTMQTAEQKQRGRFTSVELYMGIIVERINKLRARLAQSAKESGEVDAKKEKIDSVFRRQVEDRHDDIKKNVSISETAAANALSKDIMQSPLVISLSGKVDKLLMRSERLGGTLSSSNPSSSSEIPKTVNKSDVKSRVEHVIADSSNNSCFLHPLHDSIRRISSMFSISKKGPLANGRGVSTSEADLQLMTIFDLSGAVLQSTSAGGDGAKNPELVPSSIVPGLCQQCAMMVTNLHEASHESSHAFNFESRRSRQKLLDMLSAVTSESDDARTRSNVLAMLDSNNGHIKEFGFTHRQKVACLTPVNTLFGGTFSGDVAPNTVILPTSELFSCPGVEIDKFRSMAHRSIDKTVADASKRAASIVETLAHTAPNAENLFFPFKDQRRHFNSITDAIISGMSSEASSQLNTTCDQNLVQVDEATGFPVFVGRRGGKSRVTETDVTAAAASQSGGLPVCTKDRQKYVDMGAKFMVAPGSLLNANKEETLRLNRLSDINNVRHNGTDVHVAGANSTWRINEVIKAASSCTDRETTIRKMLLLGSVSAVSAQKLAQSINDPTAMLNTSTAIQNLVNEAFPSPSAMVNHVEAAESAFSTQLAYRQRLFPHITNNCLRDVASHMEKNARPLDIISRIRRYSDAYNSLHSQPAFNTPNNNKRFQPCEMLKQSVSNVPLSNTAYGAFEEASSAANNRLSVPNLLISSNDDSTNKLAVQAMTDTTVDTFSAMSSMVGRQSPYKLPSSVLNLALCGRPSSDKERNGLLSTIARINRDASLLSSLGNGSAGLSYFSSFLRSSSSPLTSSSPQPSSDISNAAERVLGSILDSAEETNNRLTRLGVHGPWGAGRPEAQALHRNAMTSILQMNEDEIARDMNDIESRIETRQLREAFQELKRSMLISSSTNSSSAPMSLLMPRSYAASGMVSRGLSTSTLAVNTVDDFNTTPLLVRYILLDSGKSPLPLAKEVKNILTQPKAVTARALLSESFPLLTELCLYNTRDTPPERAIDRLVVSAYLVKQAKRFDGVDPIFPAALTCSSHLMLSSMDSTCNSSSFLNNIKLHMNDTTSFLKNIERFETFLGRYGDAYTMSHRQNCNCPFALHHTFTPSDDEHLTPSFAFARPEITTEEIRATPYQANKLLNDKHYVMNMSKIDTRVTGSALLKKISEWTEMRMNVSFNGAFEPSKLALSNSGMTTAGVNLNVIVNPNNAKNVMGILECHRQHVCSVDAKSTIAAAMPAIFQATDNSGGNASDLVQNALPHNRYIQKSTMNAHTIIFTNVLEQLITDLGKVVVNELAGELASSVPKTVYDNTQDMINRLGTDNLFASSATAVNESASEGSDSNPRLVSDAMKNAIYHTLLFGKTADPENVPFTSTAAGPLAYDFLLSKDETVVETNTEQAAAHAVSSTASSVLRKHLARVFEAISRQVSDSEFGNIVDDIEAKIFDESLSPSSCPPHQHPSSDRFTFAIRQEFNKIISFLKILRNNITPALLNPNGALAEKMAIYLSLLSAKSKLENFFQYGLSNSSSVDLSHLKPINCSNGVKNIEDTFMYRNVHPVLIMALPENFTALLQQEQNDPEHAIENRRALTTFLGHPNTASMATGARSVVGAGGGNPVGLYVSSHILHESTVATADPVLDEQTNLSFHSPVTQDPVMVVNPFKDSARLAVSSSSEASSILNSNACSYLQVSMPTESSGLITNTGYAASSTSSKEDKFRYIRRDNTPVYLPKVTPSVLCSDASTNLLDVFSRANVVLEDVNVRFGFMPEIITAVAKMRGISKAEAIKDMVSKGAINNSSNKNAFVDAKTGDIVIRKGVFPDTRILHDAEKAKWGEDGTQKLHARALPVFLLNNPLAAAAVNGIPVTLDGLSLVEEKRRKAAGIVSSSSSSVGGGLGDGCIGTGALRAAANSRLVSDLEPLREGWENIIKLQNIFSKAASELKRQMSGNTRITSETGRVVDKLHANFKAMAECREILQNQAAILVATSDLVTGGYAGDPSVAMVAPVHPETTGLIGAISSPIKGLGHLLKREGVAAVTASIRQKLNLSTSNGRTPPEHGVVQKSAQELRTDPDYIQNMYDISSKTTGASSDEEGNLGKIMASLGLKGTKSGDAIYATKYISNLLASPEYGNRHDLTKRQSILQLLVANPDLLNNVANALFMNNGKTSISPLTTADTACRILGTHNNSSNAVHNNVQTLNRLFGSRLS